MTRTLEQILATDKPDIVIKGREKTAEMLLNIHWSELRELVEKNQVEVAQILDIRQPTVAGMEKPAHKLINYVLKALNW